MDYIINQIVFSNTFSLPAEVADTHLKLATPTQLKVAIYIFRNLSNGIDAAVIAKNLNFNEYDVNDALLYWVQAGVLIQKDAPAAISNINETLPKSAAKTHPHAIKPNLKDVGRRSAEDEDFSYLLREAQIKFGRLLKDNESITLLWLFDDEGMPVSLILMLLEYCISQNRFNISFIERTAAEWLNNGVLSIADADKYITKKAEAKSAWKIVEAAFGIEDRLPSEKELEASSKWILDWKYDFDILRLAYEKCVDSKSKFIMSYVSKLIENWHNSGYKTKTDVLSGEQSKSKPKSQSNNMATYDTDLIEKMLNEGYGKE